MSESVITPNINYKHVSSANQLMDRYDPMSDTDSTDDTHHYHNNSIENMRNCEQQNGFLSRFNDSIESITKTISLDVIVYETNSNNNNNDNENDSNFSFYGSKTSISNSFEFDSNEYEHKLRTICSDNHKLNAQLIQMEEQITDLIKDKQNLDNSLITQRQALMKRIAAKDQEIDELAQSLLYFEGVNAKLEHLLDMKTKEKAKLMLRIEEMEDKLSDAEFQLSEVHRNEAELINACSRAKHAFNAEESDKYTAVQQLRNAFLQCAEQQILIVSLNEQIDALNQIISDQRSERWVSRHIDSDYCEFTTNLSQEFDEISDIQATNIIGNSIEDSKVNFAEKHTDIDNKDDNITGLALKDHKEIDLSQTSNLNLSSDDCNSNQNFVECSDITDAYFNSINGFKSIIASMINCQPILIVFVIMLLILASILVMASHLQTNLPPYTSWEEIIYRIFLPYVTKEKVSKTQ